MNEKDLDRIIEIRDIIFEFAYLKGRLTAWLFINLKHPINHFNISNEVSDWHADKIKLLRKELHELELKLLADLGDEDL